ncbi:hypothetical protein MVEN_00738700 [Mycena venus]|uniref:Uncharacterized protein n=1 Tax=Mycena venus TaxID=2733690 RepID=A0A8H7D603_9AGAR|nr:hypothetical protein MVEN_00738700 [Mycena venus]
MQLPQELVNAIIDEIHAFTDSAPSLKSCALVARSFLGQSQKNLFAVVKLKENSPASSLRFSNLLSSSLHLAIHVNDLSLECHSENWESVAHILSAVSNLTRLRLTPKEKEWFSTKNVCKPAPFSEPFSTPHLRVIEMCDYEFVDAFQLQSLFSGSVRPESLVLDNIIFSVPTRCTAVAPRDTTTAASNLTLRHMTRSTIDAIMNSFTVLDLKELHSLSVFDSPINNILRLPNARSIRKLSISVYFKDPVSVCAPLEPEVLVELGRLQTLTFDIYLPVLLPGVLRTFGDLRDLKRLETVWVVFSIWSDGTVDDENSWRAFDGRLRVLLEKGMR